jgi:DNA replication licensing factor MCM6
MDEADGVDENDEEGGNRAQMAFLNTLTQQEVDELKNMVNLDNIYQRLVSSIAPTVYGECAW